MAVEAAAHQSSAPRGRPEPEHTSSAAADRLADGARCFLHRSAHLFVYGLLPCPAEAFGCTEEPLHDALLYDPSDNDRRDVCHGRDEHCGYEPGEAVAHSGMRSKQVH